MGETNRISSIRCTNVFTHNQIQYKEIAISLLNPLSSGISHFACVSPVNYRGSTGFGQDSIMSLIGHIGSQDVKDVQVLGVSAFENGSSEYIGFNLKSQHKKKQIHSASMLSRSEL